MAITIDGEYVMRPRLARVAGAGQVAVSAGCGPASLRGPIDLCGSAAGSIYDLLNEDKRHAVEVVVEERAAARDPEDRDGNLPDLEKRPAPRE